MVNLEDYFGAAYVLNLDTRPERWTEFQIRAAKAGVTGFSRYRAIEGDKTPPPFWWRSGNGAWGCMMSHLRLAQDAIHDGLESYVVFEDDACFSKDFVERLPSVMAEVSALEHGWDMLYLGGQHLFVETAPPWNYAGTKHLLRCINVNRTHAVAINARFMVKFAQHIIHAPDYIKAKDALHIDHQLGEIHRGITTLAVHPWLCGQAGGLSDIKCEELPESWWHDTGRGERIL